MIDLHLPSVSSNLVKKRFFLIFDKRRCLADKGLHSKSWLVVLSYFRAQTARIALRIALRALKRYKINPVNSKWLHFGDFSG